MFGFKVKMLTSCNIIEHYEGKGVKKQLKKGKNMKMKMKAKAEFLHLFMAREKRGLLLSLLCVGAPFA